MRKWAKQLAWEARVAETKWRKAMKEDIGKRERQRRNDHLKDFWAKFYLAGDKESRLALLKVMADAEYNVGKLGREYTAKKRARFKEVKGRYFHLTAKPCEVCGGVAEARHHIIQLHKGGGSHGNNLMRLCNACHKEIHPWL